MKNHAENLGWEVGVDFPVWAKHGNLCKDNIKGLLTS